MMQCAQEVQSVKHSFVLMLVPGAVRTCNGRVHALHVLTGTTSTE